MLGIILVAVFMSCDAKTVCVLGMEVHRGCGCCGCPGLWGRVPIYL